MKLFSKLLTLLFVLALLVSCGPSTPKEDANKGQESKQQENANKEDGKSTSKLPNDTLVVGVGAELNGDFVAGFTNSSYDKWVRDLIYNGSTYVTDEAGQFQINTTYVDKVDIVANEDGSKTYKYTLKEGNVWNDGTPVTAKDYVYSVLLSASAEWPKAGARLSIGSFDELVGKKPYFEGTANSFPGVKLVNDHEFHVTVAAEELPYFYEQYLFSVSPYPMHHYSPNLVIGEDGSSLALAEGTSLSDEAKKGYIEGKETSIKAAEDEKAKYLEETAEADRDAEKVKAFDEEIAALKADVEAVNNGSFANGAKVQLQADAYRVAKTDRYKPTVTNGLYDFVSFENGVVSLVRNQKSTGDFRGKLPAIDKVEIRTVNNELSTDMVINGELDLNLGVVEGDKIEKAKASETAGTHSYSRNGYGMIALVTDSQATAIKEVRQALAFLIDRDAVVQSVLGGYGIVGNGWYGASQWTYQLRQDELNEKITHYVKDVDRANELLDKTDYIYEADGKTAWSASKAKELVEKDPDKFDYWRHDASGKRLVVNHFGTENNPVTTSIQSQLPPNGKLAGLQYNITIGDFATLLNHYYNQSGAAPEDREFTAFNLATGFYPYSLPYTAYHSSFAGTPSNTSNVKDPVVDEIVTKMKNFDAQTQTEEFLDEWVKFQVWFNDYLPTIPLYSNEYYDIYNKRVKGLETGPDWDWTQEIVDLTIEG